MDSLLVPTVVGRIGHPPACRGRATCVWAKAAITSCRIGDGVISRCCGISSSLTNSGNWTSCAGSACADSKNAIPVTLEFLVPRLQILKWWGGGAGAQAQRGRDHRGHVHHHQSRSLRHLHHCPIINQPQVAILSTDGVKRRPVVVQLPDGTEGIAVHSVGNLALTWDHRAFDGAYASAFLAKVTRDHRTHDWTGEL